jgi:hypothetical protein
MSPHMLNKHLEEALVAWQTNCGTAGKQARLLSRDWGHPSMTEHAVASLGFDWWELGLF